MCSVRSVNLPWTLVASDVTTNDGLASPATGWMDANTIRRIRGPFEVAASTDAGGVMKLGIQFANVENAPQTPMVLPYGVAQTGNGFSYPTQFSDVTSYAEGWLLARLVWFFKSSSGLKVARVCGRVDIEG